MTAKADPTAIVTPPPIAPETFTDARAAVARLAEIYDVGTGFLRDAFGRLISREGSPRRVRATYPEIVFETTSHVQIDSRLSFGHVSGPGRYATTVTRPDLFHDYLVDQIGLLIGNHNLPVTIGASDLPIPLRVIDCVTIVRSIEWIRLF